MAEMDNNEIHNKIRLLIAMFYRLGLWNKDEDLHIKRWFYLIFYLTLPLSIAGAACESVDNDEFLYLVSMVIIIFVVCVRLFYILWKEKEIRGFLLKIGSHSMEDQRISNKMENLMIFSTSFVVLTIIAIVFFSISSFIGSHRRLPINIVFLWDWKHNEIAFWFAYIYSVIQLLCCSTFGWISILIWYLMLNASLKYKLLGNQFRNLGINKGAQLKEGLVSAENEKHFSQDLIVAMKTQLHIQQSVDQFTKCFSKLFLFQIGTSSVGICGTVYILAFGDYENLIQTAIYSICLLYNLFDIFMVMYFGNEIKLSSDELSYCVFESNWMEQSQTCQKCIVILMEFSKTPQELVIAKLFKLNLVTFTAILKFTYSIFNILQSLD